jgi:hypothetical protein
MKNITSTLVLVIAFIGAGCSKKVSTKNLSNTAWKRVSLVHTNSGLNIWAYPYTRTCELDNVEEFQDGGVFQLKDIGEVCAPSVSASSTWEVREGRLIIGGTQWEIDTFNDNELVIHSFNDVRTYQRYR